MKIGGQCHCGAISFTAEIEPDSLRLCHCTDCQTLSGSAFRTVVRAREGTFRLTAGEPKNYVKTGESGTKRAQGFCANCGTPIYSTGVGDGPKVYNLRLGSISERAALTPKAQIWTRSASAWIGEIAAIPATEKQ